MLLALGLSFFTSVGSLWAQSDRGTITGTVIDQSGAVMAGVSITATNSATSVSTRTISGAGGDYTIPLLLVGRYEVTAKQTGFKTYKQSGIVIEVGGTVRVDIRMQVGTVQQLVEVTAQAVQVEKDTSDRGTVVSGRDVLELPIVGQGEQRNPGYFMILAPGVTGRGTSYSGSPRMLNTTVNGSQSASNEFQLDGAPIGSPTEWAGDFGKLPFPQDVVGEFKVMTLNPTAEYGRTGQGVTSFTVRSGTNQLHGTGYELLRNCTGTTPGQPSHFCLDSRGFFNSKASTNKQNEFGGTVGGPVIIPKVYNGRDKTFFFAWYQGFRLRKEVGNKLDTVPTAAMRGGDLSNVWGVQLQSCGPAGVGLHTCGTNETPVPQVDALGRPVYSNEIYDPASQRTVAAGATDPVTGLVNGSGSSAILRDAFGFDPRTGFPIAGSANIIPTNRQDPLAVKIFSYFPDPNHPGQQFGYRNNWLVQYPTAQTTNQWGSRIDHSISDKDRIFGEFVWSRDYKPSGSVWPGAISEGSFSYTQQDIARFGQDLILRPNLVNHWTAGYNRFRNDGYPVAGTGWPAKLGYSGVPQMGPGTTFIEMDISGLGNTYGRGGQSYDATNVFTIDEGLSWTKGRHTVKGGFAYIKMQQNDLSSSYSSSYLTFNAGTTSLPGSWYNDGCGPGGSCPGFGAGGFLLGQVSHGLAGLTTAPNADRMGQYAWYIQDDFKATSKLTFNLGLRYDLILPTVSAHNQISWMDPTAPNPVIGGYPGAMVFATPGHRSPISAWTKGFGPRLGLAYALNPKTVVRAGYGILYTTGGGQRSSRGLYVQGFNAKNSVTEDASTGSVGLIPGTVPGHPDYHMTLQNGWPAQLFTPPPFISPGYALGQGPFMARPTDGRLPMIQNWTIGVQREIPGQILLDVAYVGTNGTHLPSRITPTSAIPTKYLTDPAFLYTTTDPKTGVVTQHNRILDPISDPAVQALPVVQAWPVDPATGDHSPFPGFEALWSGTKTQLGQALRPQPQYQIDTQEGLSQMRDFMEGVGVSNYNAMQIQARKRFSQGLSFLISFTWSKTLTDSESSFPEFSGWTQDFYNRKLEKSVSINDYPKNLVLSYEYELPFGPGKKYANGGGAAGKVIGGWSIAGIQQYQSGRPFFVFTGSNPYNPYVGPNGFLMRPDVVPGVPKRSAAYLNGTFDPNAPGAQGALWNINAWRDPAFGSLGNAPRSDGTVRLPKYLNEDITIMKRTRISERVNLEFRADFLNIFNRTVLGPDQGGDQYDAILQGSAIDWGVGGFGQLHSQGNYPREIQFGLKINY
jgi:hypothetical protein